MITASLGAGWIRQFTKAIPLLMVTTAILCLGCCSGKSALDAPPFTVDSLMAYSSAALLELTYVSSLKDSVSENNQGVRRWYSVLNGGLPSEALICWMDSTRTQMWEVTVRVKPGQTNLWMTRDSIRTGLSLADVQRINGGPFLVERKGAAYGWSYGWTLPGKGALAGNVASIIFGIDNRDYPGPWPLKSDDSKLLKIASPVQSFSVNRLTLPSQLIVIRKAITVDKTRTEYVPQVVNRYGSPYISEGPINKTILERFELASFDSAAPRFKWLGISFKWEQNDSYLALQISGKYLGQYPAQVLETLYFKLYDGSPVEVKKVPFVSFLRYDKFFPFFKKYWLAECRKKLAKAYECIGLKITCDCYDNIRVSLEGSKVNLDLESENCIPQASTACDFQHTLSLSLDELLPFINDFGKKHLQLYAGPGLLSKKDISDAYLSGEIPPMVFLKLKYENVVGFEELPEIMVSLQFNNDGTITGCKEDGEFHGQRPEYLGDDEGPSAISGNFDNDGFVISNMQEDGPEEWLSIRWSQETTNIEDKGFYIATDQPVTFFKHTGKEWLLNVDTERMEEETEEEGYSGPFIDQVELTDRPKVVTCSYIGSAQRGCYHYYFSCGDFVAANISQLSEQERSLWDNLSNYEGRDFQITYSKTEGWPCQAGYPDTNVMARGDVPLITGFKLLN